MGWFDNAGPWWLIAAIVLAMAELLIPGVFLVFLAIAAAITGVVSLLLPDLDIAWQVISFAAWAVVVVLIGKRWYREAPVESSDPLLNDRAARLIGEVVTVTQPVANGHGRVRVGDGEWPARGPDLPAGARARITGASGTTLTIEPAGLLP